MSFCQGVGPFEANEPSVVVTIPSYTPSEQRRVEVQQPQQQQQQEPVQVWPSG